MFDFLDIWLAASSIVGAVCIVIGFVALVKGADWLVEGASATAKRFHVSNLIIGLTVVAMGTSMPEMVVNLISVAHGTTDLAITNIVGSNIINVFVILGATALLCPIVAGRTSIRTDIPLAAFAGVMVLVPGVLWGSLDRWEGFALLGIFVSYMVSTMREAKRHPEEAEEVESMPVWRALVLIVVGLVGLVVGGELIVKGAVDIAHRLGVGEAVIGLTVVALGTSLPELATSLIAARKHNTDLALGNAIGSNIFNVFLVLGVSACIRPLPVYEGFVLDSIMAALGCVLVWIAVRTDKAHALRLWHGVVLLVVYSLYLAYRLWSV